MQGFMQGDHPRDANNENNKNKVKKAIKIIKFSIVIKKRWELNL